MRYLIISPHLDDAVLSCGEFMKKVIMNHHCLTIVTVFTGSPDPELLSSPAKEFHQMCGLGVDAVAVRKREDERAMCLFRTDFFHLGFLEALYRMDNSGGWIYPSLDALYQQGLEKESDTIIALKGKLELFIGQADRVFVPFGLGNHIDHRIVRRAAEELMGQKAGNKLFLYEDIPYVCKDFDKDWIYDLANGYRAVLYEINEEEWRVKMQAVNCYESQLYMLWDTPEQMRFQLENMSVKYAEKGNRSIRFWTL